MEELSTRELVVVEGGSGVVETCAVLVVEVVSVAVDDIAVVRFSCALAKSRNASSPTTIVAFLMLLNQDVVFLEVLKDQVELNLNVSRRDRRQLETLDSGVRQVLLDQSEAAGVEFLFDRVEKARRFDSPSRYSDFMVSGFGRQICETNSDRIKLL